MEQKITPNPNYKEIFKLKVMLDNANIPNRFLQIWEGWGVWIDIEDFRIDAVQHKSSYGNSWDLLEILGGLTKEEESYDEVLGCLTAEQVFKRFQYCYEHKTKTYVEELQS